MALSIKIKTLTGKTFDVSVDPSANALAIKTLLHQNPEIGVAPIHQRLIFEGRELDDEQPLNAGPRPVYDGAVVHLVLRTVTPVTRAESYVRDVRQPGPPPMGALGPGGMGFAYINRADGQHRGFALPPVDVVLENDLEYNLGRTSSTNRAFGYLCLIFGILLFIDGLYGLDWGIITLGVLTQVLGYLSARAGSTRSTRDAKQYYWGMFWYIITASVIIIVSLNSDSNAASNVAGSIIIGITLPLLCCGICAYVSRKHLRYCFLRDEVMGRRQQLNEGVAAMEGERIEFAAVVAQLDQVHVQFLDEQGERAGEQRPLRSAFLYQDPPVLEEGIPVNMQEPYPVVAPVENQNAPSAVDLEAPSPQGVGIDNQVVRPEAVPNEVVPP